MKEYKVLIKKEYDENGGSVCDSIYDADLTERDFGSILYCIIEDILNETDKNIDEICHILKDTFDIKLQQDD